MELLKEEPATVENVTLRLVDDLDQERNRRLNVFEECIRDGKVEVTSEAQASEIARLINHAESDLENTKAIAAAMVARAEQRLKNLEFLFMTPLAIWTSARLAGKKERSILLEGGKLSLRKIPASVKTVKPEKTLDWAAKNLPGAVELVPKLKTDAVKEWEQQAGKVAPGRVETPASESFSVGIPKKSST